MGDRIRFGALTRAPAIWHTCATPYSREYRFNEDPQVLVLHLGCAYFRSSAWRSIFEPCFDMAQSPAALWYPLPS